MMSLHGPLGVPHLFRQLGGALDQQDLVVRVVRPGHVDVLEEFLRVQVFAALEPLDHLRDAFRPEGVLRVDHDDGAAQASLFRRQLHVDGQLVCHLRLARAELAVELRDRLGLDAAAQQLVQRVGARLELADGLAPLEYGSPVSNPPMLEHFLAPATILEAVFSPTSAAAASSAGDATAIASIDVYPASLSLSAVAGPTPGKSSIVIFSAILVTSLANY